MRNSQNFNPEELSDEMALLRTAIQGRDEFILALQSRMEALESAVSELARFLPLLQNKFSGDIAPAADMRGVEIVVPPITTDATIAEAVAENAG